MWETLTQAAEALTRDGWRRDTAYWFRKQVSGRLVWVGLEWEVSQGRRVLVPVLCDDEDEGSRGGKAVVCDDDDQFEYVRAS